MLLLTFQVCYPYCAASVAHVPDTVQSLVLKYPVKQLLPAKLLSRDAVCCAVMCVYSALFMVSPCRSAFYLCSQVTPGTCTWEMQHGAA